MTALSFDGINDYVIIPNFSEINFDTNDDFTVEAWIKVNSTQADLDHVGNAIIEKWSGPDGYPFVIRYQNITSDDNGTIGAARWDDSNFVEITSTTQINDGRFHHIAFVKNGETLRFYIDGIEEVNTEDITQNSTQNDSALYLGRRGSNIFDTFFTGEIDELRIWNIARTETEIQTNLNRELTGSEEELIGYWNFNESSGSTAIDQTGNGNDGEIIGAVRVNGAPIGSLGNDILTGDPEDNIFDGWEGNDILAGGIGNDNLNGGAGNDDLNGGPNNDILNGSSGEDVLVGGSGNDNLNGGADDDDLNGGSGKDTLNGDSGDDILIGGADADFLNGGSGNDILIGGAGADTLNGGSGADVLIGKAGNDTYIVDNLNDIIIEKNNGGKDIVKSSVSYELAANLENLTLTGNKAIDGTGNKLRNNIKGNKKDNKIEGLGGNDIIKSSSGNDTLSGGDGADNLNGQAGNDDLFGGNDNDKLIGGGGSDHLFGESGNDNLKGNGGNDSLDGGSGKDTLIGASGNDVLTGGRGKDVLTGGSGSDEFVFNSFREGADRITDFAIDQDKIVVSASGFGGELVERSPITSQQFTFAEEATSATHRFIYSRSSGDLFFDQDGSGEMEPFHLATFSGIPFLFHTDIEVVA